MIVVRDVFQAKYGMGDQLVELFKEIAEMMPEQKARILTDLSGPFFTVVTEFEVENLAAWETMFREEMSSPDFAGWFSRMQAVVESGRREYYTLVA